MSEEEIEKYYTLEEEAKKVLESAVSKFGLSHRSIASIKKQQERLQISTPMQR